MKRLAYGALLAGLSFSTMSTHVVAQDARSAARSTPPTLAAAPAPTSTSPPSPLLVSLIDELTVSDNSTTVRKLLPMLKEKVPAFQYIAEDGPWQDLLVPKCELRNVTIVEVLNLLQRWNPSFHWDTIGGDNRGGGVPIVILGHEASPTPLSFNQIPIVQAFSLSAAIDRQMARDRVGKDQGNDASRKKAASEVMSLLENVASQASLPNSVLTISIHDDTETLVVKGYSTNQIEAVSRAVQAFSPPMGAAMREDLTQTIKVLEQTLAARDRELADLKARLEGLTQTTAPSEKK